MILMRLPFDPGTLRRLVEQHQSGMRDHSAPLWSLLMFEAFLRTGGAAQAASASTMKHGRRSLVIGPR